MKLYNEASVFDIEANGFLDTLDTIHCIAIKLGSSGDTTLYHGDEIPKALEILERSECLVGHNIQSYDIPAIQKVYPQWEPRGLIRDTLIMSRLQRVEQMRSHSLEAWGAKLKNAKGDFKGPWDRYTPVMGEYCIQDVNVNYDIWVDLLEEEYPERAIQLEHDFANILDWQMFMGIPFNEEAACILAQEVEHDMGRLDTKIRETVPAWEEVFIPKVNNSRYGYTKGVPFTKRIEFNPGSRQQVIRLFTERYSWAPVEFTDKGNPKISGDILRQLSYPESDLFADYFDAKKLAGQLISGDKAWLRCLKNGRIHGYINHNGAGTHRCTHNGPNLAQVPRVGSYRGAECRGLFQAEEGKRLVGCDASGLELRNLAHYMAMYDGGRYAKVILDGDIHTENQSAAGLPTRDAAKTFIYAHNYGAGDAKLGSIVNPDAPFEEKKRIGKGLRSKFMTKIPALRMVIDQAKQVARTRKFLYGLDGRKIWIRSDHRALNSLLQCAGSVIMKEATVLQWKEVIGQDLKWRGKNYENYPVLHIHDETQNMITTDYVDEFKEIAEWAITKAGENFEYKCPLAGEAKEGLTWKETH